MIEDRSAWCLSYYFHGIPASSWRDLFALFVTQSREPRTGDLTRYQVRARSSDIKLNSTGLRGRLSGLHPGPGAPLSTWRCVLHSKSRLQGGTGQHRSDPARAFSPHRSGNRRPSFPTRGPVGDPWGTREPRGRHDVLVLRAMKHLGTEPRIGSWAAGSWVLSP